jgi:hypothetical protein
MNKRYSISESKCEQRLIEFYNSVAEICGISVTANTVFDCRKICVTKAVQDSIIRHYSKYQNLSSEEISARLLLYGPKANLNGDGYDFEVEDGFASEVR